LGASTLEESLLGRFQQRHLCRNEAHTLSDPAEKAAKNECNKSSAVSTISAGKH
jgi:hypothetical protein